MFVSLVAATAAALAPPPLAKLAIDDGIVTLFGSSLKLVGTAAILFTLDARLALLTYIVFPILGVTSLAFRIVSADAYRATREKVGQITAYLQETLSGMRVVRSFAQE